MLHELQIQPQIYKTYYKYVKAKHNFALTCLVILLHRLYSLFGTKLGFFLARSTFFTDGSSFGESVPERLRGRL